MQLPKIEKGIPIHQKAAVREPRYNWKYLLQCMEVGDSFVYYRDNVFQCAATSLKITLSVRFQGIINGKPQYRIWRIE